MIINERKRMGNLLVDAKILTEQQLTDALKIQKKTGYKLGQILVDNNFVNEEDIINTLEYQLGIKRVNLSQLIPDEKLINKVPETLIRRHQLFPVAFSGNRVIVAMSDPLNLVAIQDLEFILGKDIEPVITSQHELTNAIQRYYGLSEALTAEFDIKKGDADKLTYVNNVVSRDNDAPVIKAVNTILQKAVEEGASDIHIEPREKDLRIRLRVDGILREILFMANTIHPALVTRIKIMAEMDIAEKRLPQDGGMQIKFNEKNIDLRVSSIPSIFGEKIVIRILDNENAFLTIDQLRFHPKLLKKYKKLLKVPYGVILITGPTGSGKTTTLYASLNEINDTSRNIVTIEDPVEYVLPGVTQIKTNIKAGMDFAKGLRSILRQDPDVIMIGEIRDNETAKIAVRAANTGHLVFSTLHTNNAVSAITRLIDMGVEPFLVGSSVIAVVAQRLVRSICPYCIEEYEIALKDKERMILGVSEEIPFKLKRGKGCANCGFTGYKGRLALHELLIINSEIQDLIIKEYSAKKILDLAVSNGMNSMFLDGVNKVKLGFTTVDELLRVTYEVN
ncbi:MAG: GspE/PulE family protein [Clostridia bacterium]|nr:GspE/PulE family protein [Clostridia bacterium]MDD4047765.1 GspE/PulE family protein [Clostridia bacterium]